MAWQEGAYNLFKRGISVRKIGKRLNVAKSTVADYLKPFRDLPLNDAKVLVFDIETAPMEAYVWNLYPKFISTNQLKQSWTVLTWSAKWLDSPTMMNASVDPSAPRDDFDVVEELWQLFDEADIVVAHNGDKFDVKRMNTRFLLLGLPEPSPYRSIDTLKIAKRKFSFASNRLDYISKVTGGEGKLSHEGFGMWEKCLQGDAEALQNMQDYNDVDVLELERVYKILRSWDHHHPNLGAFSKEEIVCPVCSSGDVTPTGKFYMTQTQQYPTFRCGGCGKISRSRNSSSVANPKKQGLIPSK
mgnify:FL=1